MIDSDKAKGMLWGLIVGDAFGSPIQFSKREEHPWITEMEACPVFGLPPAPAFAVADVPGHELDDVFARVA